MNTNEMTTRRKKWPILIIVIPAIVMIVWPLLFFGIFWIENFSFSYVDEFKFSKNRLSLITGEPFHIPKESYSEKCKEELNELINVAQIFPTECPEDGADYFLFAEKVKKHRSYYDRFEAYVVCEWGGDSFSKEKERLSSLKGPNERSPLLSYNLFPYPSYIFEYLNGRFCYSLLNENQNKIYYIALFEIGDIDNVVFDHLLAPKKRLQDSDVSKEVPFGRFSY